MRETIRDKDRLEHILEAMQALAEGRERHGADEVNADPILYYGFVKNIEIIGEAVYKLTKEFKEEHPEVPWKDIEAMRHVLVHGYYDISPSKVWATIERDIPALMPFIITYIEDFGDDDLS